MTNRRCPRCKQQFLNEELLVPISIMSILDGNREVLATDAVAHLQCPAVLGSVCTPALTGHDMDAADRLRMAEIQIPHW